MVCCFVVFVVSWDECRSCCFGSIYLYLWHPNVCVLASACVCVFWSNYAHNRALASPMPLALQIHRLFFPKPRIVCEGSLCLSKKKKKILCITWGFSLYLNPSDLICSHLNVPPVPDAQKMMQTGLNESPQWTFTAAKAALHVESFS